MTASELEQLTERCSRAAHYFRNTNPAWSRTFKGAATAAQLAAERERKAEERQRIKAELQGIKAAMR
jgi:hypothetical protein